MYFVLLLVAFTLPIASQDL